MHSSTDRRTARLLTASTSRGSIHTVSAWPEATLVAAWSTYLSIADGRQVVIIVALFSHTTSWIPCSDVTKPLNIRDIFCFH